MELVHLIFFSLLLIISYFVVNHLFQKTKTFKSNAKNLPPGSTGWPLVGETMEFGRLGGKGTPEIFFQKRMKKHSEKVFKTSLIGEKTAVLCGVAGNKFLFSNESKLVSIFWPRTVKKILPHITTVANVAEQTHKIRSLCADFLKPDFIQNCVGIVDGIARKHLDSKWDSQKEVKAAPLAKEYAFAVGCKLFLSIDDPSIIQVMAKSFSILATGIFGIPVNLPGMAYNKGIKASNSIREKLSEIIRERKAHLMAGKSPWSQDILWNMILVPDDKGRFFTEMEMADIILIFFLASHDSISTTVTFLVKYLAEFHQVYQQVLKEQRSIAQDKQYTLNWKDVQRMKYSWNVISEVLRFIPPAQGGFREALTDFTYFGYNIPKGWKLYWTPNTTHKDPRYFSEPEKFDPSRFEDKEPPPYSYVPFGGGSLICPGKDLSRVIILVFLHNLVQRFHWEILFPDETICIQPIPVPIKGLPIRLHAHN